MLATEGLRYDCERLLIVAHQAVIMVFRYVLEELTEQELLAVDKEEQVANASLTRYDRDADGNLRLTHVQRGRAPGRRGRGRHRGARCRAPALSPTHRHPRGAARLAAARSPTGDKNARGSILVIGGSSETLGAVLLAAEAAMRAGAGQAAGGDGRRRSRPFAAAALPEALVRALPETDGGAIRADAADAVRDLAEAADAVLIGPGHGRQGGDRRSSARGCSRTCAGRWRWTRSGWPASPPTTPACTTSTAGSCSRRTRWSSPTRCTSSEDDLADDPARRRRWSSPTGRGPSSAWAASPRGSRRPTARSGGTTAARPGWASPGPATCAPGITGGLLARGADPAQAAVWAAFLHGRCGERLSSTVGRLGFLARELPPEIPRALAEITG